MQNYEYKKKLGTKMNNYLWPLPGPWKGPGQVRGPEVSASLASPKVRPPHILDG